MNRRNILVGSAALLLAAPAIGRADMPDMLALVETHKVAAARVNALVASMNDLEDAGIASTDEQESDLHAAHDAAYTALLVVVSAVPSSGAGAKAKADYLIDLLTGEGPHDELEDEHFIALLNSIVEQSNAG